MLNDPSPAGLAGPMPALFATETPPQWLDFVARRPRALSETAGRVLLRQAHIERARELAAIGRRAYGPDRPPGSSRPRDHWDDAPPFVDGRPQPGFDCENLALWVRRVMAEEFYDWPLGAGRPALCVLPDGRAHCVLAVVTESDGDLVVGSQHAEQLVPWHTLAGYHWLKRLHAGNEWRLITV